MLVGGRDFVGVVSWDHASDGVVRVHAQSVTVSQWGTECVTVSQWRAGRRLHDGVHKEVHQREQRTVGLNSNSINLENYGNNNRGEL